MGLIILTLSKNVIAPKAYSTASGSINDLDKNNEMMMEYMSPVFPVFYTVTTVSWSQTRVQNVNIHSMILDVQVFQGVASIIPIFNSRFTLQWIVVHG